MIRLLLFILILSYTKISSQVEIPLFSEPALISQQVANTHFSISYERPKANNRVIFGGLVPYDEVWRTGASYCTKITFDREVFVDFIAIPPGTYSLFSIPRENEDWTIILNKDTSLYGAYDYDPAKDVVRLKTTTTRSARYVEAFSISIDVINDNAMITLAWTDVSVSFNIHTNDYNELKIQAAELLKNDQDLEENTYTILAEYILHNRVGMGPDAIVIAHNLVDKALAKQKPTSFSLSVKRKILKLLSKEQEYKMWSDKHIAYLRKEKPYEGWEEDIKKIEEEISKF